MSIVFAIPDHPWYVGAEMAAVRVAMTVGVSGRQEGQLLRVVDPSRNAAQGGDQLALPVRGKILADLAVGVDLDSAKPLLANEGLCRQGVKLGAPGFIVTTEQASQLDLGAVSGEAPRIRPYLRNRDVTGKARDVLVIDLFGLDERGVSEKYPKIYKFLLNHVRGSREQSRRKSYRDKWWIFVEPRPALRAAISGLDRYIATPEVAKFRPMMFVDGGLVPDASLYVIASDDKYTLGVLTSVIHATWSLHAGGRLGVGNDPRYHSTRCFDAFPFPATGDIEGIRELAGLLDAHRKQVLATHEDLTLTGLYNVLEKLRSGEALTAKERDIHERGLVSVMKRLHDQIDDAVFDAYGWPRDLSDEAILERLVALNKERRAEEARGVVRWLRPAYQAPAAKSIVVEEQGQLDVTEMPVAAEGARKVTWPRTLPERVTGIRGLLATQAKPSHAEELARRYHRAPRGDVQDVLNALVALGLARRLDDNRYAP